MGGRACRGERPPAKPGQGERPCRGEGSLSPRPKAERLRQKLSPKLSPRNYSPRNPPKHSPKGAPPLTRRARSNAGNLVGVRCAERRFPSSSSKAPVRLVVFDLDETLTLTTFMSKDGTYTPEQYEFTAKINFESPWVEGSRIDRLRTLFKDLSLMKDGTERTLALLTRNNNAGGISAAVNLLAVAGLAERFSVVWSMPWKPNRSNGLFQQGGRWKFFDPPVDRVADHKAHVLAHIAEHVEQWVPHRGQAGGPPLPGTLGLEEIVLVDDQRANFMSKQGAKVLRYCKVARYDAHYYDFGLMKDMGGIGAHDPRDFALLQRFIEDPHDFQESWECSCVQLEGSGRRPVILVVFDFDETLTLATFMPEDKGCRTQVGWTPHASRSKEWTKADLVAYNFESPWCEGSRVEKLKALLSGLTVGEGDQRRTLAILTRNSHGAVAVLNLLLMAGLAEHFSAIWRLPDPQSDERPEGNGVYQKDGRWQSFSIPLRCTPDEPQTSSDVLHHITEHPDMWFPQLRSEGRGGLDPDLVELAPQEIALVDDDRANFWSNRDSGAAVLRYCKVMRYDRDYRDCGFLHNMGGIGANSDTDYETIGHFIQSPWDYPYRGSRPQTLLQVNGPIVLVDEATVSHEVSKEMSLKVPTMRRERASTFEEPVRTSRRRSSIYQEAELDTGDGKQRL